MFKHALDEHSDLRLLELRDAEALYRLVDANRVHLRRWMPWVDGTRGMHDIRTFIETTRRQLSSDNAFQAGLWHRDRLVGVIGFHGINRASRSTSIGYWLDAGMQGQGLMTRACEALVGHALVDLGLNRVEIRAAVGNQKSRAIPERLGFQQEGVIREAEWLYDHFVDHVVYGMLGRDWAVRSARRAAPGSVVGTDDERASRS